MFGERKTTPGEGSLGAVAAHSSVLRTQSLRWLHGGGRDTEGRIRLEHLIGEGCFARASDMRLERAEACQAQVVDLPVVHQHVRAFLYEAVSG